jgi:hypothetical protein
MGLPMYVSPSPSKRQLPSKQPTSPPYTPQAEEDFEEAYQNSRTSAFDIPEPQQESSQRGQRSRRSTSLPYNLVQQHIQRLHQLHHLHRTREQQISSSSNLASRRGLNSSHHLNLNRAQHIQAINNARRQDRNFVGESIFETVRNTREERLDDPQDEIIDFSTFDDFVSSLDNNNNSSSLNSSRSNLGIGFIDGGIQRNNNTNNDNDNSSRSHHHSSSIALDNVIRRVNLLRQISQQQESRMMRSSSRHHRSTTGHSSSGRSSRMTSSQSINVDRRRDDLVQRGIDIHPSSTIRHSGLPEPTLLYPNEHNAPTLPSIPRLSAWHTRRGVNWSTDPQSQQRSERRSSFVDDFYSTSDIPHPYDDDHRILSPIPRRYDARFSTTLPIGNEHELLGNSNNIDNRSNVDRISSNNEPVRTEQRGSASGEVC